MCASFCKGVAWGTATGANNAPNRAESPPKGGAVLLSLLLPYFAKGAGLHASHCLCKDTFFFSFFFLLTLTIAHGRSALLLDRLCTACVKPRL